MNLNELLEYIINYPSRRLIIGIDGKCGAGKTTLAGQIAERTECNVIHADSFFLPDDIRNQKDFPAPGANLHVQRLRHEVIEPLCQEKPFEYGVYSCAEKRITSYISVPVRRINIIEGSYCLHPYFKDVYDIRIFLDISPKLQKERILARDGKEKLIQYEKRWIPMEKAYFAEYNIKKGCNLRLDFTYAVC